MPSCARLRLTAHLQTLAITSAEDETPCLYSLVDFLQTHHDQVIYIVQQRGPASCIREPSNSLFGNDTEDIIEDNNEKKEEVITKQIKSDRRLSLIMKKTARCVVKM